VLSGFQILSRRVTPQGTSGSGSDSLVSISIACSGLAHSKCPQTHGTRWVSSEAQAPLQYCSPISTWHRQGGCAHFITSFVTIEMDLMMGSGLPNWPISCNSEKILHSDFVSVVGSLSPYFGALGTGTVATLLSERSFISRACFRWSCKVGRVSTANARIVSFFPADASFLNSATSFL
jgi:hypothetical protein